MRSGISKMAMGLKPSDFALLTLAGIVNAFGVTMFLYPVKLYDSGISGLSMLLDQMTNPRLTLSLFLLALNLPIFIFSLKRLKVPFAIRSIYAIAIYSLTSYLILNVLPVDLSFISPLAGSDLLLCAIFGGVISGVGSGLTIRFGGAIDGIDVLSVMFAKRLGISIGTFTMMFNAALYVVAGMVMRSWILPLYSIVTYFAGSRTVDFVVEGLDRSKCAMIVTSKADEITKLFLNEFRAGGTVVNAIGGYSRDSKQIVYLIVNRFQISKMTSLVRSVDSQAFISVSDVSDVVKKQEGV